MINFVNHKAADEYETLSKEERDQMGVTELIEVANALREVCTQKRSASPVP